MEPQIQKHHHHILPTKHALMIGASLLVLTVITVWVAGVDLGHLNFVIAMAVATCKASLVALFFMNLIYDRKENAVIFVTSFVFLAIFLVLTATDLFFRGDVAVKGPLLAAAGKSKFKKAWIVTPELIAHGKELFQVQCVSCHGEKGIGDGPAASALNPRPRNFTVAEGWKNGRKPTEVFGTLTKGIPGSAMASYATLPPDDRWALAHYVLTMSAPPPADTPADFAKVGIDPAKEGSGPAEAPTIPIEFALEQMAVADIPPAQEPAEVRIESFPERGGEGKAIYLSQCASCHGDQGKGGIRVKNLGVYPTAYVTTRSFEANQEAVSSFEKFADVVAKGIPGEIMPGHGELTVEQLRSLQDYVKSTTAR